MERLTQWTTCHGFSHFLCMHFASEFLGENLIKFEYKKLFLSNKNSFWKVVFLHSPDWTQFLSVEHNLKMLFSDSTFMFVHTKVIGKNTEILRKNSTISFSFLNWQMKRSIIYSFKYLAFIDIKENGNVFRLKSIQIL